MLTNAIFGNELKIFVEMQMSKSEKRAKIAQRTLKFHKMTLEKFKFGNEANRNKSDS